MALRQHRAAAGRGWGAVCWVVAAGSSGWAPGTEAAGTDPLAHTAWARPASAALGGHGLPPARGKSQKAGFRASAPV